MIPIQNYKKLLTDLVRKQMIILGPNIARDVAARTKGLEIDTTGAVTNVQGEPVLVLQSLVNAYSVLNGPVTQLVLFELLETFKEIKQEYNQPISNIRLRCALEESPQP